VSSGFNSLSRFHLTIKLCKQSHISYKTKNKIITGNVMLVGQKVILLINKSKVPPKGRRFTAVAADAKGALKAVSLKLFRRAI
jgi:hypothetical protein